MRGTAHCSQVSKQHDPRVARTPIEAELRLLKCRLVRSEAIRRDSSQQFALESKEKMVQMQVSVLTWLHFYLCASVERSACW